MCGLFGWVKSCHKTIKALPRNPDGANCATWIAQWYLKTKWVAEWTD